MKSLMISDPPLVVSASVLVAKGAMTFETLLTMPGLGEGVVAGLEVVDAAEDGGGDRGGHGEVLADLRPVLRLAVAITRMRN